ncbi:MAG: DUF6265 family protein [Gemmatimonadota bacterium]
MKKTVRAAGVAWLLGVTATTTLSQAGAGRPPAPATIDAVSWLEGCWERQARSGSITTERWFAPRAAAMFGMSATIRNDTLRAYEMLLLRAAGGQLQYIAHITGQPPATFTATLVEPGLVKFENPEHDFPQEITYRRNAPDSVTAVTAGSEGGQRREVPFAFRRVRC